MIEETLGMAKRLLATTILTLLIVATGASLVVHAQQDRVSVVGNIELEDGVPILVTRDGQLYDLEGTDLTDLNSKRVEVTGTLVQGEGTPLIQVESYRQVE
jgi:hypothetical protein